MKLQRAKKTNFPRLWGGSTQDFAFCIHNVSRTRDIPGHFTIHIVFLLAMDFVKKAWEWARCEIWASWLSKTVIESLFSIHRRIIENL